MKDDIHRVQQFHEAFGLAVTGAPTGAIPAELRALRIRLLEAYVLFGTYVTHGLQGLADTLFEEVHRSNMSKLDENGRPIYREDGKVLKSAQFSEPDLETILARF